jgi:methionyl-tRNA formyltransferase
MKILYMGTPDFAVAPLRALVEGGYNVAAVVTSPDKPAGRGLKMQESAVKRYATEAGLRVLQPEKLRDSAFLDELRAIAPDLGIVIAFRMLPEVVWAMPRLGTFNLHASLLPQYRGAAPINWAIINGETHTGVTTFMLNAEIDKGAILGQREIAVTETDTAGTLHDKLMHLGTELVLETVDRIAAGEARPVEQPSAAPGVLKEAPKIFKETCRVDWCAPLAKTYNLIRGLSPYPAAWSELTGPSAERLAVKLYTVHKEYAASSVPPGTVVSDGKAVLKVASPDGYIVIDELQVAGKKRMPAADFLRGFDVAGWGFE